MTGPRRLPILLLGLLLVTVAVACEPVSPPAPPLAAPANPARAGTWRAEAESWVAGVLFPFVLDRSGTGADARAWGARVVRTTPLTEARILGRIGEARALEVRRRFVQILERPPTSAESGAAVDRLGRGSTFDTLTADVISGSTLAARHPNFADWLNVLFAKLLGRPADAAAGSHYGAEHAAGRTRRSIAAEVVVSSEARSRAARLLYEDTLGRAATIAEVTWARAALSHTSGDEPRLRAELAAGRAPRGYRVGVVGDSVAFDLTFRPGGEPLPAVVLGDGTRPAGSGSIACGVLSARRGYRWPSAWSASGFAEPRDGACPGEVSSFETSLLATRPEVLVWQPGAWEWQTLMGPDGTLIPGRSPAMRSALANEMVRRVDLWRARGVRRVLLAEWACVGSLAGEVQRDPGYSRFIRSVLVEVATRRAGVASIAPTPPQVCAHGDPTGVPTAEHRRARGNEYHWIAGPGGAAWGWANWFAPAIADLTGVR